MKKITDTFRSPSKKRAFAKQIPLVLSLMLALALSACGGPSEEEIRENTDFLKGQWIMDESDTTWNLSREKYTYRTEEGIQNGIYTISEIQDAVVMTLDLTEKEGDFDLVDSTINVQLMKDKDQVVINGEGPFSRPPAPAGEIMIKGLEGATVEVVK